MRKPTIKQKIAFTKLIEKIENKEPIKMGEIMLQSGFSKVTAVNPGKNLLEKVGWQQLLAKIDDSVILERINNILIDEDKRASLQAADMLLKLKDRYPANKIKMTAFDERDKVLEEINLNVEDGTYKETFNEGNI